MLLVPLDGSEKDTRALAAAANLAALSGNELRLIEVLSPPAESLTDRALTMGGEDAARKQLEESSRRLSEYAARVSRLAGQPASAEIVQGFDAGDVLIDRSTRSEVSAIVMATRAASAMGMLLLGSVVDRVVRDAARPVFIVPPEAPSIEAPAPRSGRVLVTIDGSGRASRIADPLGSLDREHQFEFVLLEVLGSGATISTEAERVADELRSRGGSVRVLAIEASNPAETIVDVARREQVDFITMASRCRATIQRLMLGSVTEQVLRSSGFPVLVLTSADLSGESSVSPA